jgi:hypothetical protein
VQKRGRWWNGGLAGQCKSQGVGGSLGEKLASPVNILIALIAIVPIDLVYPSSWLFLSLGMRGG